MDSGLNHRVYPVLLHRRIRILGTEGIRILDTEGAGTLTDVYLTTVTIYCLLVILTFSEDSSSHKSFVQRSRQSVSSNHQKVCTEGKSY